MKKTISIILAITLVVFLVTACGQRDAAVEREGDLKPSENAAEAPVHNKAEDPQTPVEDDEIEDPNSPVQSEAEDPDMPVQSSPGIPEVPSIAGISLGDSIKKVEMIFGENYKDTLYEEFGHFGEPYYVREYDGISLIIGKDSEKVLEIDVLSDKYETWLGDKIGDAADVVLPKYREKFTEPVSIHDGSTLEGWFELGDGLLLIFDFDKDDEMIINPEITSDSKVEVIKLTHMAYMD
jgi:hypothetical protein